MPPLEVHKSPRSDPRKRRKHLNAQSQKETSPFVGLHPCHSHSYRHILPDLCADPTLLAMLLSIPNPAAVVKDIVKFVHFRQEMHRKSSQGIVSLLRGALYPVSFMACLR